MEYMIQDISSLVEHKINAHVQLRIRDQKLTVHIDNINSNPRQNKDASIMHIYNNQQKLVKQVNIYYLLNGLLLSDQIKLIS